MRSQPCKLIPWIAARLDDGYTVLALLIIMVLVFLIVLALG